MSKDAKGYIVAFNRDRDAYEVPLALAEEGRLVNVVTDYYHGAGWPRIPSLKHRLKEGLAPDYFINSPAAVARQGAFKFSRRFGLNPDFPFDKVSEDIAKKARSVAESRPEAGLLLYSTYAYLAFTLPGNRHRVLFQYHPGRDAIRSALSVEDDEGDSWLQETEETSEIRHRSYEIETGLADQILVASQYVRRGLIESGVSPHACSVVPYGCPPVKLSRYSERRDVLFVGQAVRRKGIKCLLRSWADCDRDGRRLLIASSYVDPHARPLIEAAPDVDFFENADDATVSDLMSRADALVLPSLVEGFGLVLTEALAHGCRLVATPNTGLPDLQLPDTTHRIVDVANVEHLVAALNFLGETWQTTSRSEIYGYARERSWAAFRKGVASSLACR